MIARIAARAGNLSEAELAGASMVAGMADVVSSAVPRSGVPAPA
jgi:hypothetical protein